MGVLASGIRRLRDDLEERSVRVDELPSDSMVRASAVIDWLDEVLQAGDGPVLVYVGGHGVVSGRKHFVALDGTPQDGVYGANALWSTALCELVGAHAPDVALLVDTCFAGEAIADGVTEAAKRAAETVDATRFALVASCRAFQAEGVTADGLFVETLSELMRQGPLGDVTAWGPGDELIPMGPLVEELRHRKVPVTDALLDGAYALRVVPNLAYTPDEPEGRVHVRTALRRLSHGAEAHLLDKSDAFVGRASLRAEITEWLTHGSSRLFVITGGPGTGKSALVGLLARQSVDDEEARTFDDSPSVPVGTFDLIVHVRQKTLAAVRDELDDVLEPRSADDPPVTVLVDALDGAVAGEATGIAAHLAAEVKLGRVRMLVGTRPAPVVAASATQDPLLRELVPSDRGEIVRNLDAVAGTMDDIAWLVGEALVRREGLPYDVAMAGEVAAEVAQLTSPSFLFAHAAIRWLTSQAGRISDRDDWRELLARYVHEDGLGQLIEDDLAARYQGDHLTRVRDLLRALAWAEGLGIPRYTIWPTFADALAPAPTRYGDPEITWVLNEAGWYITEATEDGQSVYRLFHQALTDYFRHRTPP